MKSAVLTLCFLAFVFNAPGAEKIEGGFGLKLGDVFHPKGEPVSKYGHVGAYEFKPEKPNPALSTYLVFITPTSHRVYRILAAGVAPDPNTAQKLSKGIAALLHQKYGSGPFQWANSVTQDENRIVATKVDSDNSRHNVFVLYEDRALANQGIKEKQADELKDLLQTTDGIGL